MSCGRPHDTPCREVLANLYLYLDRELDPAGIERIRVHLHEEKCWECLSEHDVDALIKKLVCRCSRDQAPDELRQKILARLRQRIDDAS